MGKEAEPDRQNGTSSLSKTTSMQEILEKSHATRDQNLNKLRILLTEVSTGKFEGTELDLHALGIQKVPPEFENAVNPRVDTLDVSENTLTQIPFKLPKFFPNLTMLNLGDNNIKDKNVLKACSNFHKLTRLKAHGNHFDKLPGKLATLPLEELNMFDNEITKISKKFQKMTSLTILNMSDNNGLKDVAFLSLNTKLRSISLRNCSISNFPSVEKCRKLEVLELSNNKLEDFPNVGNNTTLHHFHLSSNRITEVPDVVTNLLNLEVLDLAKNKISELPRGMNKLHKLKHLRVQNNRLTHIHNDVYECKRLVELDFSNNSVHHLHKSVDNLKKLKFFSFSNNRIQHLPLAMTNLNLTKCELGNNPFDEINEDTLKTLKHLRMAASASVPSFAMDLAQEFEVKTAGGMAINIKLVNSKRVFQVKETGEVLHPLSVRASEAEFALLKLQAQDETVAKAVRGSPAMSKVKRKNSLQSIASRSHSSLAESDGDLSAKYGKNRSRKQVNYGVIIRE